MLLDLLFKLGASLVKWLIGFFPRIDVSAQVSAFADAYSQVRPVLGLADWYAPVHEALAMLAALITIRAALLIWFAVNWFYKKIPILGH